MLNCIWSWTKLSADCARALKDYLNTFYEDYKIISIGTSPEPIAFGLENLGCDVVYLPFTNGNKLPANMKTYDLIDNYPNLETTLEYLKSQKINATNNKKIILLDYSSTGKTLALLERLIREYNGVKNIESWDLLDKLSMSKTLQEKKFSNFNYYNIDDRFKMKIDLGQQRVEIYSKTPHFDVASLEKIETEEKFKNFTTQINPTANAYELCILNELHKQREL